MTSFLFIVVRHHSLYKASTAAVLTSFFSLPNFPFMFSGHQSGSDNCICHCTLRFPVSPPLFWLWGERGFWTRLSVWSTNTVCSTFTLTALKKKKPTQSRSVWPWFRLQTFSPTPPQSWGSNLLFSHQHLVALWHHRSGRPGLDWGARPSDNLALACLFAAAFRSLQVTVKGQNVV